MGFPKISQLGRGAVKSAALCVLLAGPLAAQEARLTPENLKKVAFVLLQQGKPEAALEMANALLVQVPGDTTALVLKSRAERDLGHFGAAHTAATQAWQMSQTPRERYSAALSAAQALSSDGQKFRAQFWLRRAIQAAPSARAKSIAATDLTYVRSRSRLALSFDIGLSPSSNVNNGASTDTVWFLGLPFTLSGDAQALSGAKGRVGVAGRYRLAEQETRKTDLRFSIAQDAVVLSGSASAAAPNARGRDYAFSAVEIGVEHSFRPGAADEVQLGTAVGRNWYGGDAMSRYVQGSVAYRRDLTPAVRAVGGVAVERQWRDDVAARSADVVTLSFGLDRVLANRDRVQVQMRSSWTQSASADVDHKGWGASLDWTRAAPILRAQVSVGLSVAGRDYGSSPFSAQGRHDLTLGGEVLMAFDAVEYMGFKPVVSLETSATSSNIGLFNTRSTGLGLRVQSKF